MEYQNAGEAKQLAQKIIDDVHPHLSGIPIEYVFALEEIKVKGKLVLGRARKKSGLDSFLRSSDDEQFFVIEIWKDAWISMSEASRKALLDHELSHCKTEITKDGDLVLKIVGHDLEEFNGVVERHGLWQPDVYQFAQTCAARQPRLFEEAAKTPIATKAAREAVEALRPKKGSGIDSVTISSGGRSVSLRARD